MSYMMNYEIWKLVMQRFPKIEKERTCRMEKEMRDKARQSYYNTLYERFTKESILAEERSDNAEFGTEICKAD